MDSTLIGLPMVPPCDCNSSEMAPHCGRSSSRLRSSPRCRFMRRPDRRVEAHEARRARRRREPRRRHRPHGAHPPEDHPGAAPHRRADQRREQARRRQHDRAGLSPAARGRCALLRDLGDFAPHQSHHRQDHVQPSRFHAGRHALRTSTSAFSCARIRRSQTRKDLLQRFRTRRRLAADRHRDGRRQYQPHRGRARRAAGGRAT